MTFAPAPEYHVFPTKDRPLKPYEAVVRAARRRCRWSRSCARSAWSRTSSRSPRRWPARWTASRSATRRPARRPAPRPGRPPYSIGRAAAADARVGARFWRRTRPRGRQGASSRGARAQRDARAPRARAAAATCTTGSRASSASSRRSPTSSTRAPPEPGAHTVGPLLWEIRRARRSASRRATAPVVLVAPSTSQDPEHRMLRAALDGLADSPCA